MKLEDIIEYIEDLKYKLEIANTIIKQQQMEISSLKFNITNLEAKLNITEHKKLQPIKELSFEEADNLLLALQKIHFPKNRENT